LFIKKDNCDCYRSDLKVVRLGELDYESETDDANPVTVEIIRTVPHPNYMNGKLSSDIALIELAQRMEPGPDVRPLCLPSSKLLPAQAIATGWGKSSASKTF
jgi:hypothetical protein